MSRVAKVVHQLVVESVSAILESRCEDPKDIRDEAFVEKIE